MHEISLLKIDKDCEVDGDWTEDYVRLIVTICRQHRIRVLSIKMSRSQRKGVHYYVEIDPPMEAEYANRLQWLLGDDPQRVNFNRARIASGLTEWNKLFETSSGRLRTIYKHLGK